MTMMRTANSGSMFTVGNCLWNGTFGKVNRLHFLNGLDGVGVGALDVAGKEINGLLLSRNGASFTAQFKLHFKRLKALNHENLVQYIDFTEAIGPRVKRIFLLMEYPSLSLADYIAQDSIPLEERKVLLLNVAKGLCYLHSQNPPVYHGDLCAKNIIVTAVTQEKIAKIADFGMLHTGRPDFGEHYKQLSIQSDNVAYMPPEALLDECLKIDDLNKFDVFSFGVLILHVMTGNYPYEQHGPFEEDDADGLIKQKRQHIINELEDFATKQLVFQCLKHRPKFRPSIHDVAKRMEAGLSFRGIGIIICNSKTMNGEDLNMMQQMENYLTNLLGFFAISLNHVTPQLFQKVLETVLDVTCEYQLETFSLAIFNGQEKEFNLFPKSDSHQILLKHLQDKLAGVQKVIFFNDVPNGKEKYISLPSRSVVFFDMLEFVTNVEQQQNTSEPFDLEEIIKKCSNSARKTADFNFTFSHNEDMLQIEQVNIQLRGQDQAAMNEYMVVHSIWQRMRTITIELLKEGKEEVRKVIRNSRIFNITGAALGLGLGGGLAVAGLVLIPFTFGVSMGLAIAGGSVGAMSALALLGASITRRIMSNKKLVKAQQHIVIDRKISILVNDIALCSISAKIDKKNLRHDVAHGLARAGAGVGIPALRGIGAGIEAGLEVGGAAVRAGVAGARIAGGVAGGVALLVTVPMDVYQIVKNAKELAEVHKDQRNEKDQFYRWFNEVTEQLETELKSHENIQSDSGNDADIYDIHLEQEDEEEEVPLLPYAS